MSKIYYNKLVRDKTKEVIEAKGASCEVRTVIDDNEFQQELLKKVMEEARAFAYARTPQELLEEYADMLVLLDTLMVQFGISEEEIKKALELNIEVKGLYNKRHFLHWSDDDKYESRESPQGLS